MLCLLSASPGGGGRVGCQGEALTTLPRRFRISPLKNAAKLNEIGEELAEEYGVPYLPSDFKKKNGYKRSVELSAEYGLYRQDYCGCVFSEGESRQRRRQREAEAGPFPEKA